MSKIARITNFTKVLHLEREKVMKGFEISANFAKIAKVRRIFPAM